jgi:hypothetical protein
MPEAAMARLKVQPPPTASGSDSRIAPVPPNSKMVTRLGACSFCASEAASMGMPVPMKAVVPSSISREAVQISSSEAL